MTVTTILHGDSAKKLAGLEANTIDICVTSPPYDNLRKYNGHDKWDFEETARQIFRVLKPGGVLCWNVMDSVVNGAETLTSCKQKIFFVEGAGFHLQDTMIWEKPISSMPDTTRYFQVFEYVFVLSKGGTPKTFNPIHDRKNIYHGLSAFGQNSKRQRNGDMKPLRQRGLYAEFGMRGNVWKGNTRSQEEPCKPLKHHAMMPRWLAKDLIRSWSNEGDTVLDPFGGSGTVGFMAKQMNRHSLMIDKDKSAIQLMRSTLRKFQPELV